VFQGLRCTHSLRRRDFEHFRNEIDICLFLKGSQRLSINDIFDNDKFVVNKAWKISLSTQQLEEDDPTAPYVLLVCFFLVL